MTLDYADGFAFMPADVDAIVNLVKNTTGNGVISGLGASVTETNLTVTIVTGAARAGGIKYTFGSTTNVDFTGDPDGTNPRKAIIVVTSAGTITKRVGTPKPADPSGLIGRLTFDPDTPELVAGDVPLHEVWLPTNVTQILSTYVSDRRFDVLDEQTTGAHEMTGSLHLGTGAAAGDILRRNSGNTAWERLPVGAVGQVLTVTGSLPAWGVAGGAGASYYGVRAEDFITSGIGTDANPYNLSAITSAINALPSQGGIVFIKEGVYRGTRIFLGGTGQAGRSKSVILQGASADLTGLNWANYQAVGGDDLFGTVLEGGFEINTYGCQVHFKNLGLRTTSGPNLKFVGNIADEAITQNNAFPLGGFRIEDCKFYGGDPAIWVIPGSPTQSDVQNWNVLIERIHIREAARGIRIEDTTGYNGIFRGNIKHCVIQALSGQAISVDIANLKGVWEDIIVEDCGSGSTPTVSIRCARAGPGFSLTSIDFGDACNSTEDAFFECYLDGMMKIQQLHWGHQFNTTIVRNVRLRGFVDFEGGAWNTTGNPNQKLIVDQASKIYIRPIPGDSFVLGTVANPTNVYVLSDVVVGADTLRVLKRQA